MHYLGGHLCYLIERHTVNPVGNWSVPPAWIMKATSMWSLPSS